MGQQGLKLVNQYRATKGLPALAWNQEIHDQAYQHSKDMAEGKLPFDHDGSQQRIKNLSFRTSGNAEGVSIDFG